MAKRISIFLLCAVLMLCGCTDYKQLKLSSCSIGALKGLSYSEGKASADLRVDATVLNPTGSTFEIRDISAVVYYDGKEPFATISALDEVTILPGNESAIPVVFKVTFLDPLSMLFGTFDTAGMFIDVDAVFHTGMVNKKISEKRLSVDDLVRAASGKKE